MKGLNIAAFRVNLHETFRRSAVFTITVFMSREIVQVHWTSVGVLIKQVIIKFSYFIKLLDMFLHVDVVLVHHVTTELHELNVALAHVHEDGRALDDQADVYAHKISGEDVDGRRVNVIFAVEALGDFSERLNTVALFLFTHLFVITALLVKFT